MRTNSSRFDLTGKYSLLTEKLPGMEWCGWLLRMLAAGRIFTPGKIDRIPWRLIGECRDLKCDGYMLEGDEKHMTNVLNQSLDR